MQVITNSDGAEVCLIDQALPARSQRLGYTGLIRSGYEPDRLSVWVFGPNSLPEWRCLSFPTGDDKQAPSAEPIPDDEANTRAKSIMADLNRISRRYGRWSEDVAQEAFSILWEALTADTLPRWVNRNDYRETLRKAVRRARKAVVVRHVPPPMHRLLSLEAPPESTLVDGPGEVDSAIARLLPTVGEYDRGLVALCASMGMTPSEDSTPEQWGAVVDCVSAVEREDSSKISVKTARRRVAHARTVIGLSLVLADSVGK